MRQFRWGCLLFLGCLILVLGACQAADMTDSTAVPTLPTPTLLPVSPTDNAPALDLAHEVAVVLQEVTVNIDQEGVTAVVSGLANDACLTFEVRDQSRSNANVNLQSRGRAHPARPLPQPPN
ncbi:MAG: hypothetical protein KDD89_06700 [Anaerolineales bacterium]|nr:hypothetical protein [Anaerolineales bacterium]